MEFLTISEAAEFLPFEVQQLYKHARSGKLQAELGLPFVKIGLRWLISKHQLSKWLKEKFGHVPAELEAWSRKSAAA